MLRRTRRLSAALSAFALAMLMLLAACAPAAPRATITAPAKLAASATASAPTSRIAPPGDARVRMGDSIDLGFLTLRLRAVEACSAGVMSAVLDVGYRAKPSFGERAWTADLIDDAGAVIGKTVPIGFGCPSADTDATSADTPTTKRLYFDANARASWLAIALDEPHGFAHYRVELALRAGLGADIAPRARAPRPPPPAAHVGDSVETEYYRITPLRIVSCGYTMYAKDLWAAEILVENFSNVPLSFPATGAMLDEQRRKYEEAYGERAPCSPALDAGAVAPGANARGFVHPIEVARGVKSLDLLYAVASRTMWSPSEVHTIHLGALPLAAMRGVWEPPTSRETSGAGYRVTVTSVRRCTGGEGGKDYVGVEILVENTGASGELMGNPSAAIEDTASYRYEGSLNGALTECAPSVENPFKIKPGQKVRGWLNLFHVALDSGPWTLHYRMWVPTATSSGSGETMIDLPVGKLAMPKGP